MKRHTKAELEQEAQFLFQRLERSYSATESLCVTGYLLNILAFVILKQGETK